MKPILTIGIILILLATIAVSKQRIDLNDYEEECFEYKKIPYITNFTFPILSKGCFNYDNLGDKCEWINEIYFYSSTKNGDCIKYHLVRRA